MEIQVAVSLDGKVATISDGLSEILVNLTKSYIKQILGGGKARKNIKKAYKLKDPNAPKRERRAQWTDDEINHLIEDTKTSLADGNSINKTAKMLAPVFNRASMGILSKIYEYKKAGRI
jgi:hypothetical protein